MALSEDLGCEVLKCTEMRMQSQTLSLQFLQTNTTTSHTPSSPTQHLNIIQEHKRNIFEVNLPNKVAKIMAVPPHGTVSDAIRPVLVKHGYDLSIMELRFANNFKVSHGGSSG